MTTVRFEHVHLRTADLTATVQWYVNMLGGTVAFLGMAYGAPSAYVDVGDMRLSILAAREDESLEPATLQPRYGLDHFALAVDDLDAAVADLRSKGAHILREPFALRAGGRAAFVEAPDRVRVELVERRD